ncbi:SDR family NAD(P)-dependent oxidoreductase [Pseudooceanicola sp.]|jgi:NAD(P)-dependent dehydrogenase (short-subunit alcohol dehydrogenase family)|uniref:SDR family NAD(P)-dependent oxidoreductase n=1 Tax=Pseudooceanicola sp. TaxID=1914328 RepID=UPI0040587136
MLFRPDYPDAPQTPTALVTGADSHGIGRGVALRLAEDGADVALHWYRDEANTRALAALIQDMGRRAVLVKADMGDAEAARRAVRQADEALGGIGVLVCNAARIQRKPFFEITDADWDALHAVNMHGYFACGQEAARLMVKRGGGGRIVMISSVNQAHANPDIAHYVASKGGVMMLARSMALELAASGVTVNLVAPGTIETDINRHMLADEDFRTRKLAPVPMGRAGTPEDIADAVAYLAGQRAGYVTGSTITVDGGLTIS